MVYLLTVFAQIFFWRSHSASCDSSCGPRAGPFDSSFHLAASRTVSSATLMVGFLVGWTNLVALPLQQFLVKLLFPLQQFLRYDCFFISTVHFFSSSNFFPSLGGTVLTFTFSPSLHLELLFQQHTSLGFLYFFQPCCFFIVKSLPSLSSSMLTFSATSSSHDLTGSDIGASRSSLHARA